MAVMTQSSTYERHIIDYLNRLTPPWVDVKIQSDPVRPDLQLCFRLKLAVHWTGTPVDKFQTCDIVKFAVIPRISTPPPISAFRQIVDEALRQYAKEIASGVMQGRRFNRFAFEGGTIQELAKPGAKSKTPTRPDLPSVKDASLYPMMRKAILQSTPKGPNGLNAITAQYQAIAGSNGKTLDLSQPGQRSDPDVAYVRESINIGHNLAINFDTIRLTEAQLNSLMSDAAFPTATPDRLHPDSIYGCKLEVVR